MSEANNKATEHMVPIFQPMPDIRTLPDADLNWQLPRNRYVDRLRCCELGITAAVGVLRDQYRFSGGFQTGRMSSKSAQIQNLTRDVLGEDGAAEAALVDAIAIDLLRFKAREFFRRGSGAVEAQFRYLAGYRLAVAQTARGRQRRFAPPW